MCLSVDPSFINDIDLEGQISEISWDIVAIAFVIAFVFMNQMSSYLLYIRSLLARPLCLSNKIWHWLMYNLDLECPIMEMSLLCDCNISVC